MITTNLEYEVDLAKGFVQTKVKSILATYDDLATVFSVKVLRNGKDENLTGASCSASFKRSDDTTIPLVGSVSGNVASVTLSESCYRYAGKFEITIKLSLGDVKSTIFIGSGSIYLSETDAVVDDEDVIPSIADIIAQQQAAEAATNAANQAASAANAAASSANSAAGQANTAAETANTAAQNASNQATNASQKATQAEQAAESASAAAILANEKADLAGTNAALALSSAQNANEKASAATQSSNSANQAAASANSAADLANTAASNANNKAQSAQNAADRANNAAQAAEDVVAGKLPFFDGTPSAPGEGAAGVSTLAARGDHVHPLPTLLPVENGGTGATSVDGIKQTLKSFSIVGAATDANLAVKIGLYGTTSSTANLPSGTSFGNIFNISSTYEFNNQSGIIDQFFFPVGGGKIWRRSNYNDRTWSSWTLVALDAYPVGAIYMSYVATSPASLFGGEWTQIRDRFLVGVGSSYAAGATGGEATHKLTVDELPSHSHNYSYPGYEAGGGWYGASGTAKGNTVATTAVGGGAAHENRPPYFAVYIWRRTA